MRCRIRKRRYWAGNPYSIIGSVAFLFDKCLALQNDALDIQDALSEVFIARVFNKRPYNR
ncbi:MAG: hypothetical protein ACUZ8E_03315 [Candidatus Anammoxibacter sp.]